MRRGEHIREKEEYTLYSNCVAKEQEEGKKKLKPKNKDKKRTEGGNSNGTNP